MTGIAMKQGFTDGQLAALRAPLARDHVKSRQQAGRTLSYIEGWVVIAEANRIFGFDGWDRETVECRCVTEAEVMMGANKDRPGWRVAYVGRVCVTVRAGDTAVIREGTGYGSGIDADLGQAHESAIKECETDCTKRAMMTFGNPMGLALYDKTQAEVEPVAGRRTAPQKPADDPFVPEAPKEHPNGKSAPDPFAEAAPSSYHAQVSKVPAARSTDPDRRAAYDRAVEVRDRIREALAVATTPALIEEIVKLNSADLKFLSGFHRPSYQALMDLATRLKT